MSIKYDFNYEAFFSLNLDLFCIADKNGNFNKITKAWCKVFGYSEEELLNKCIFDFVHPDDLQRTLEANKGLLERLHMRFFKHRFRHKNGSYKYIEWQANIIGDFVYSAVRDVTDYELKEQELINTEARLQGIIELQSNYFFRANQHLEFIYANNKFLEDFNWLFNSNSVIGTPVFVKNTQEKNCEQLQGIALEALSKPNEILRVEEEYRTSTGENLCVLWECICLESQDNKRQREIQFVGMDITAIKELERKEQEQQSIRLLEMTTPITELWDGILLLPLVGLVTAQRAESLMTSALNKIALKQAKFLILDISGVNVVDTEVANHLIKLAKATKLMGCICTLSGISPAVAQTMIELGIKIEEIQTTGSMKDALEKALSSSNLQLAAIHA